MVDTLKRMFAGTQEAMLPGAKSTTSTRVWSLVIDCMIAGTAVIIAASQPETAWEWFKFVAGLLGAIGIAVKRTWSEAPGS